MRTDFQVALYDSATGAMVSKQTNATVQGFAATLLNGTYENVAIAMMRYCDAVLAYKAK